MARGASAISLPCRGVLPGGALSRTGSLSPRCSTLPGARQVPACGGLALWMTAAMTRSSPFGHPFLLGFDEIEQALDRVSKAANDGYPPYNIERLPRTESQPVVRGRQVDERERHFLHRGIAARQFQRTFLLADGMEVLGADLANGLLSIDLVRPEPDRIVRKIDIGSRG